VNKSPNDQKAKKLPRAERSSPNVKKQDKTQNSKTSPSSKQKKQAQPAKKISEFVPPSKDLLNQSTKPEKQTKEKTQPPVQKNQFKRTALNEFIETGANVYSKLAPKDPPKKQKKIGRRPK